MYKNRFVYQQGRRSKSEFEHLNITSLLDILIILLFFLLIDYNASGVVFNVAKNVVLPRSESQKANGSGIIIQVSPTSIWVDEKLVLDVQHLKPPTYDQNNRRIIPLYNELVKKKETIDLVANSAPGAAEFTGVVNLVVDKTIKYNYLKKILFTCAEAGYQQYKFVVLEKKP